MTLLLDRPHDVPAAAWFSRYNFHRDDWLDEVVALIRGDDPLAPAVVLLSGPAGIGRFYFLAAAAHRCGARVPVRILPIDLDGGEPDASLQTFLEHQCKTRLEGGQRAQEVLSAMTQLVQTAATTVFSWHAWALAIAMAVGLEEPAKRLGAALRRANASHEGARFVEREILNHLLLDLAGERVILHVKSVHLLTMDARRWLVEAAEKHPHLLLVVSILADDGDEVMPLHMIRRGLRRFDFEPLDVAAIRELLDRRLTPNDFPRFFEP
ncbi:MAG: hypothetical protein HC897_10395 [Thermoanaerobaculia bacterium]|nr:hypothetical protein [Thermoanaerobaculia bacterium]